MGDMLSDNQKNYINSYELADIHDGWENLLAGLGRKQDKTTYSRVGLKHLLDDIELTAVWYGEGMGKKIITVVADDMTTGS